MPETRTCDKCGQTDDHPRHVQYVAFNHPVSGHGVDLSVSKHIDCCAEDGCPYCTADMQFAPPGVHGDTMREFLVNRPRELKQYLFEHLGLESEEFRFPVTVEGSG